MWAAPLARRCCRRALTALRQCAAKCQELKCECFTHNAKATDFTCWVGLGKASRVKTPDTAVSYTRSATWIEGRGHETDGRCSGRFPYNVEIVDEVFVEEDIKPGRYVVGFRWDCEKSAQIWQSCADITVE